MSFSRHLLLISTLIALSACRSGPSSATDDDDDGFSEDMGDCDDANAAIHPGADDVVGDAVDQSCDGIDGIDADADGSASLVSGGDDCDDTDSDIHPGAEEVPYDAVDQDCDGADLCDADGDAHDSPLCGGDDCRDDDATVFPGAVEIPYDTVDQDCSGSDECDVDDDGYPAPECGGDDCDDTLGGTHPDGVEIPYDGVDQDCDGADLCDVDGDGFLSEACGGDDCNDDDDAIFPGAMDLPEDGVDQDCDGVDPRTVHSIYDVQTGAVAAGEVAKVRDVVVSAVATLSNGTGFGFFASDPVPGPYTGVWVYMGSGAEAYAPGDLVDVIAPVQEYDALGTWADTVTELNVAAGGQVVPLGGTAALPTPVAVDPAELLDPATAEPWEGVLISIGDTTATSHDLVGEFDIEPGLVVNDKLFPFGTVYAGDSFTAFTGILDYHRSAFKLLPRDAADMGGPVSTVVPAAALPAGGLVLTEIMINPGATCADTSDEYLELYNAAGSPVDLDGLTLHYGNASWELRQRVVVAPDATVVLGRKDPLPCYGITPAGTHALPLANSAPAQLFQITRADGLVIDEVDFATLSIPNGASLSLDPSATTATANDAPSAWCVATSPIGTSGDLGTPGALNDVCGP